MKAQLKSASAVGAVLAAMAMSPQAQAIDTEVQFSTTGTGDGVTDGGAGGYDVVGINEFDWQSSGDLVILDDLTGTGSTANGALTDSFATWAATAVIGDTVTFDLQGQARLNDMTDNGGGSVAPTTLDTNGAADGPDADADGDEGFEITVAFEATETATLIAAGILQFNTINGTYSYFYDDTPDSDVDSGTGFTNGTPFLSGDIVGVSGTFIAGVGGSNLLTNTVTSYDDSFIQADPASNQPLVDTTFDTLVSLRSTGEAAAHDAGDTIGFPQYIVVAGDLGLKADANSEFSVPEPGTLMLLGSSLLGLAGLRRRSNKADVV
ncbi:flocculation-associated PEP-CTERM protein PepA [Aromatoleum bremense]|uniref:Flocculation-associated PEP-CTERM protein PepA n=1 Tax=Aromatoleum bremense TaxID=76115 RepID=A0ABX1NTE4_9RHOO|nr:flocculation-associated PEP-CTERM protein PepA [Aromatoleum bremense]NMG15284.1 flocculation-associated PEP-CTERM protein PepA [Aromatoleum bremense]QTQ33312.1 PEP-CTERM protein-sorting domain-containing protein [Aromatoleum bremense]